MKTILISMIMFLSAYTFGQTVETRTFVVKGNCGECKERIENAADIKGVKVLKWDSHTKIATATFDSQKVTLAKIQEAIAASGYDAGDIKADTKAYARLPKCCKYKDGKCEE